jgi:hypothetical protein
MDVTKVEITVNDEIIFGLYPDENILVKDDIACLATARERLTAALQFLGVYSEPSRTVGQG